MCFVFSCCADTEATTVLQRTCLLEAAYKDDPAAVKTLLLLNADTTKTDRLGWSVALSHSERIRALLREHYEKSVFLYTIANIMIRLNNNLI